MSNSILLECSQYNSASPSTSEWTTTFSEEVVIENGDAFELQQCLINTKTVSSGSINLEEDVNVVVTVAYYEIALGTYLTFDTSSFNRPLPNGDTTVVSKKNPDQVDLAQTIYDQQFFLNDGDPYKIDTNFPAGMYLLRQPSGNVTPTDTSFPLYTADISFQISKGVYEPATLAALVTKKMSTQVDESLGGTTGSRGLLINLTHSTTLGDKRMIATLDTFGQPTVVNAYTHRQRETSDASPVPLDGSFRMVGASTFELSFDGSTFSITNCHSPIMGPSGGGDSGIQFYTNPSISLLKTGTGNPPLKTVDCYSGCIFTAMEPRSFWNKLGFSDTHIENNMLFDDSVYREFHSQNKIPEATAYLNARRVKPAMLASDFRSNTESGVASFETKIKFVDADGDAVAHSESSSSQLIATTNTDALIADNNYTIDEIGYFRVEAETVISNDYKQPDARQGSVVGIVSTTFESNDWVTGFNDGSSLTYYHRGEPQVISAIKIKIVDPLTGTGVVGLGPNSTVFLQLIKALPTAEGQEQSQQKKKK